MRIPKTLISFLLIVQSQLLISQSTVSTIYRSELTCDSSEVTELMVPKSFVTIDQDVLGFTSLKTVKISYQSDWSNTLQTLAQIPTLEKLEIIDAQLTNLPTDLKKLKNLISLTVRDNNIEIITNELDSLYHLKELVLVQNQIQTIEFDLGKLKALEKLDIRKNDLSELKVSEDLEHLTYVDFSDNEFTIIPNELINGGNLTTFKCGRNKLTIVPDSFWKNDRLEVLQLKDNQLTSISKAIGDCQNLTYLNLSSNQLQILGFELSFPKLDKLNLGDNLLETLPPFKNLKNLRVLDLSGNQLKSLPKGIEALQVLTDLDVSFNELVSLDGMNELNKVQEIFAIGNQLKTLDFSGAKLSELRILGLNSNQLKEVIIDLDAMGKLVILELRENQLNENTLIIKGEGELEKIDIGENVFKVVPKQVYGLNNLKKLDASYNAITKIEEDIFYKSGFIQLECQSCSLSSFPVLTDSSSLQNLFITNNKIVSLDLRHYPALVEVEVSKNPISSIQTEGLSRVEYFDVSETLLSEDQLNNLKKMFEDAFVYEEEEEENLEETD